MKCLESTFLIRKAYKLSKKPQEKIYRSGLARIAEAKRWRVKFKLTKQEQDAFDYFNGRNFYKYYQSLETLPNIFNTK